LIIVAAGGFAVDGSELFPSFNNLKAEPIGPTIYRLTFDNQDPDPAYPYVIKGSPIAATPKDPAHTFEVIARDGPDIIVRVGAVQQPEEIQGHGFMVEILDLTKAKPT
jgi:hypothetical protein